VLQEWETLPDHVSPNALAVSVERWASENGRLPWPARHSILGVVRQRVASREDVEAGRQFQKRWQADDALRLAYVWVTQAATQDEFWSMAAAEQLDRISHWLRRICGPEASDPDTARQMLHAVLRLRASATLVTTIFQTWDEMILGLGGPRTVVVLDPNVGIESLWYRIGVVTREHAKWGESVGLGIRLLPSRRHLNRGRRKSDELGRDIAAGLPAKEIQRREMERDIARAQELAVTLGCTVHASELSSRLDYVPGSPEHRQRVQRRVNARLRRSRKSAEAT
jgi:hypothetical protein